MDGKQPIDPDDEFGDMYFDLRDFIHICMGRKLISSWYHGLKGSCINDRKPNVVTIDACINKFET